MLIQREIALTEQTYNEAVEVYLQRLGLADKTYIQEVAEIIRQFVNYADFTTAVLNFVLFSAQTHGLSMNGESYPSSLPELQDTIRHSYKTVTGATVATLLMQLVSQSNGYPDAGNITLNRYEPESSWQRSIQTGLSLGVFLLDEDNNTLLLSPSVFELFFKE